MVGKPEIIIIHAEQDIKSVLDIVNEIEEVSNAWSPFRDMLVGADRELEVERKIKKADFVVLCVSQDFCKRGEHQKYSGFAKETFSENPPGRIFLLPLILGDLKIEEVDCPLLKKIFYVKNDEAGIYKLKKSIEDVWKESLATRHGIVGRKDDSKTVLQCLRNHESICIQGLPGIGKSKLLHFVCDEIKATLKEFGFTNICYGKTKVGEEGTFDECLKTLIQKHLLVELAENYEIDYSLDIHYLIFQLEKELRNKKVFLAIDGADREEEKEAFEHFHQKFPEITVAITSRLPHWKIMHNYKLNGLRKSDAVELFQKEYGDSRNIERRQTEELCEKLGSHPMSIIFIAREARGRDIALNQINIGKYIMCSDLMERFETMCSQFPKAFERVFLIIGLLKTTTFKTDILSDVGMLSNINMRYIYSLGLFRFFSEGDYCTVHDLFKSYCLSLVEKTAERHKDRINIDLCNYYVAFLQKRKECQPDQLLEIDKEWPNIEQLLKVIREPNILLDLADKLIGDFYDDPNGYIPRFKLTTAFLSHKKRLLDATKRANDRLLSARVLKNIGHFEYWQGNYSEAETFIHQAQELYRLENDIAGDVATIWLLGYLADDGNNYALALNLYKQGWQLAKKCGHIQMEAIGNHLIGCTYYHQGRYEKANDNFQNALDLLPEKDHNLRSRTERRIAYLELENGTFKNALRKLLNVRKLCKEMRRHRDLARIDRHIGLLYLRNDRPDDAEKYLSKALKNFQLLEDRRGEGATLCNFATLQRKRGKLYDASLKCKEALKIAKGLKSMYGRATAHEEMAEILKCENASIEKIHTVLRDAYFIYSSIGHRKAEDYQNFMKKMAEKKTPKIEAVILDLMDTVAELPREEHEKTVKQCAILLETTHERFSKAWKESKRSSSTGKFTTTRERIEWVAKKLNRKPEPSIIYKVAEEQERMWKLQVKLYPDAIDLLSFLKSKRVPVAILTNGPVAMKRLPNILGIDEYIYKYMLSSDWGYMKPDKEIYKKCLAELGVSAEKCIYVGDGNDRELEGAHNAGLFAVKLVRTKLTFADPDGKSIYWDKEVDSLTALKALIEESL